MSAKTPLPILLLSLAAWAAPAWADTNDSFERIKNLAGDWEGTYVWSGQRSGQGRIKATYYLTGNGSAVVEDLSYESEPIMTSVYHMDGADLRISHFCAAGNQPRLKATYVGEDKHVIKFSLVDITNLAEPAAGHVHKVELQPLDETRLRLKFTFLADGKESDELIELTRVRKTSPSPP